MICQEKRGPPEQPPVREASHVSPSSGSLTDENISTTIVLFLDTLGMHPDFFIGWKPSDLGDEPPF